MSAAARLAAFAAVLAVVFGAAIAAGRAVDADAPGGDSGEHADSEAPRGGHGDEPPAGEDGGHGGEPAAGEADGGHGDEPADAGHAEADAEPAGLSAVEGGVRLVPERSQLPRGRRAAYAFRIADERGRTVRSFRVEHERRMHLIVVRRDMTGYQHVHPRQRADGSWTVPLTLPQAGTYRVFADFEVAAGRRTLATDVTVPGAGRTRPLPAASGATRVDGYDVSVRSSAGARREGEIEFEIRRDGRPVTPEPYLGAAGHLVALREGDLAYLHVHPEGDRVAFAATYPSAGRYRLYLQFKHGGRVRTAELTQEVR